MSSNEQLFEIIAKDLMNDGVSILKEGVPDSIAQSLRKHLHCIGPEQFKSAIVGRGETRVADRRIRRDDIYWIDHNSEAESAWLLWAESLQAYLNRHLYLGLFSFESHFAHYSVGDFYEKHCDAFKGQTNRILSVVTYLNEDWQAKNEGELLIYGSLESGRDNHVIHKVVPEMRTLVIFLSEEFPHEVLPAKQDRYSIAGWFRVNNSSQGVIDPPQ